MSGPIAQMIKFIDSVRDRGLDEDAKLWLLEHWSTTLSGGLRDKAKNLEDLESSSEFDDLHGEFDDLHGEIDDLHGEIDYLKEQVDDLTEGIRIKEIDRREAILDLKDQLRIYIDDFMSLARSQNTDDVCEDIRVLISEIREGLNL